jgi:SAM-dependent methyltransferase
MQGYDYQPKVERLEFDEATRALRTAGRRVVEAAVDAASPSATAKTISLARQEGLLIGDYIVDVVGYRDYFRRAEYTSHYPGYYSGNQTEKTLEHFIVTQLLEIEAADRFVDLASEHSPLPEIARRLVGATTWSQDIMYPQGIDGDRIGGDACKMPVADGFFTKAALTCSIEHFEGDADTRLFLELGRVLRPGGAVCVVPLYFYSEAAVQTDPTISVPASVPFDADAVIHCAKGWGNRHGRFYSPRTLAERILRPSAELFHFRVVHLPNAADVHASVYACFALVATRR